MGVVIPCVNLTADEIAVLQDENMTRDQRATQSVQDNVPASYAIYMYDPGPQTWLIVAAPPPGFMNTDPIAMQPRTEPAVIEPIALDTALAARGMALIEVRSVYDTDGLNRMGENMLPGRPTGRLRGRHRQRTPLDAMDTRPKSPGAEGPGRRRLRLRAGALRPRHAPSRRNRTRWAGARRSARPSSSSRSSATRRSSPTARSS
jgi:hypothetical protein